MAGAPAQQQNPSDSIGSDWGSLSDHLQAYFFPVERVNGDKPGDPVRWERAPGSVAVRAPLTDSTMEMTANWTSPFENTGADSKLPFISAMLQTGGFEQIVRALKDSLGVIAGERLEYLEGLEKDIAEKMGVTGITKVNSTQVFTGMPPFKFQITAHFRALRDPLAEVRRPVDALMQWALPQKLEARGLVERVARNETNGIKTLYPSLAPLVLGMRYADMLFRPVVIESIQQPLTTPRDAAGRPLHCQVTMSIASLTAIDRADWQAAITS